ncbi:MerR family transcriptional regulator [Propioniferax innocua]|uniref:MerR-like DNA binding protein n=1 Tax=Propioniferax innocua TaxID=1753 RepID=A0A542ZQN7_9ACTN|nr:MerR family transcriptional regulator [Propioniferax innocua]TQL62559.1 MerR-like DNA binding protein [Propioniferax innocua]
MAESTRSIGQVLNVLKSDFSDISISKIRFLEAEGLISPVRAPSGYRRYSEADIERLRYILRVQRDNYLPLKVIREHLDMMDRGVTPPTPEAPTPVPEPPVEATAQASSNEKGATRKPPIRMTRTELLEASGLTEPQLHELERAMVVQPRRGTKHYGREAVTIAIAARRLAPYGVDARHLRQVKSLANREYGIIEQAIAPYQRRRGPSRDVSAEVTQLLVHVHAAMVLMANER